MSEPFVTAQDVVAARARIGDRVRRTPMRRSEGLSRILGAPVLLKLEHVQVTGSFKIRGATNAVLRLPPATRGVAAVSTGNHGRALAHAGRAAGLRVVICLSRLVPPNKVEAIRAEGAEVRVVGRSQDEAQREVDRLVAEEGMATIPPFDHADVVAGQGTLGLEIAEEVPDAACVLVPLSGGGLLCGVATALEARRPGCRVLGLTMERGAAMQASLAAGRPVEVEEVESLADSLGGGIGLANRLTFPMTRALMDEGLLVDEAEVARGHAVAGRARGPGRRGRRGGGRRRDPVRPHPGPWPRRGDPLGRQRRPRAPPPGRRRRGVGMSWDLARGGPGPTCRAGP